MNDENIRQNIKNNLLSLRKKNGLTQSDIADITGKKAPTIASYNCYFNSRNNTKGY